MPQTPPAHFVMPRKLSDVELAQAIRLDLEAELDAINLYEAHLSATDNPLAKRVLQHIADEEREHAELFRELLLRLDPVAAGKAAAAPEQVRLMEAGASDEEVEAAGERAEHGEGAPAAPAEEPAPAPDGGLAAPEKAPQAAFTVGSLRGPASG